MTPVYELRILEAATRDLARLDRRAAKLVAARIRWLSANLETIKPAALKGDLAGLFKLRAGDYRVFYEILSEEKIIIIHQIGHRREIYRKRP